MNTLLEHDLGIVQMPCPEFLCMGLEKELYGDIPPGALAIIEILYATK